MLIIFINLILLVIIAFTINSLLNFYTKKTYGYVDKQLADLNDTDNTIMDAVEAMNRIRLKEKKRYEAFEKMVVERFEREEKVKNSKLFIKK